MLLLLSRSGARSAVGSSGSLFLLLGGMYEGVIESPVHTLIPSESLDFHDEFHGEDGLFLFPSLCLPSKSF